MERACRIPRPHRCNGCSFCGQLLWARPGKESWRTPRPDDLLHLRLRRNCNRRHVWRLYHQSGRRPLSFWKIKRKLTMATLAKDFSEEKVNGPVAAALLAGGIGSAAMGLITLIYELDDASAFAKSLAWNKGVGGLSGKSGLSIIIFFVAWAILHYLWKDKDTNFAR